MASQDQPSTSRGTSQHSTADTLQDSDSLHDESAQYAPISSGSKPQHGNGRRPSRSSGEQAALSRSRSNSLARPPTKERRDPNLDLALPYRTLSPNANFAEFTTEDPRGEIPGPPVHDHAAAAKQKTPGHPGADQYKLVTFTPGDPENPRNWSKAFRWYCTLSVALTCFIVAFCSSVITPDIGGVSEEFGVSREVALLTITVFVVGFGVGPMAFAPLSEVYGRRVIYASTLFLAVIFVIPCARAPNFATLIVCRAIDGIAFSAPMTLVGGTLADLWRNEERGVPMAAFSAAPFIGPAIGPLVGGFLTDSHGWRWLYYMQLILSGAAWFVMAVTIPETYAPTILARRAAKLRKETGDPTHVTETELDSRPVTARLGVFLVRPFQLLFLEPIVFLITLYMSVLYGLLYMFFIAFPIVYTEEKGWSASDTGLMFIPLAVGVVLSAMCSPFVNKHYLSMVNRHYEKEEKAKAKAEGEANSGGVGGGGQNKNKNNKPPPSSSSLPPPPPELRLVPMMFSCWLIPIGMFIFAWTSQPRTHWAGPAFGGFPVGFGFIFLYNSANNYLVDSYQHQAASALAAKTFLRSFWGAGVVLFTAQMYDRLGTEWASSLLAFLAAACCAIPFLFWKYGDRIRARSKYAYSGEGEDGEGADASDVDEEKGLSKGHSSNGAGAGDGVLDGPLRDEDEDADLRRARSYVSNP